MLACGVMKGYMIIMMTGEHAALCLIHVHPVTAGPQPLCKFLPRFVSYRYYLHYRRWVSTCIECVCGPRVCDMIKLLMMARPRGSTAIQGCKHPASYPPSGHCRGATPLHQPQQRPLSPRFFPPPPPPSISQPGRMPCQRTACRAARRIIQPGTACIWAGGKGGGQEGEGRKH